MIVLLATISSVVCTGSSTCSHSAPVTSARAKPAVPTANAPRNAPSQTKARSSRVMPATMRKTSPCRLDGGAVELSNESALFHLVDQRGIRDVGLFQARSRRISLGKESVDIVHSTRQQRVRNLGKQRHVELVQAFDRPAVLGLHEILHHRHGAVRLRLEQVDG